MKLDKKKYAEQLNVCKQWVEKGRRGTLVAVTGFGKTTVALILIRELNKKSAAMISHVVVPTIELKKQWEQQVVAWKLQSVEIFVINTYISEQRNPSFLILDEIHRYGSDMFSQVFGISSYQYILGLTATIERQDGNHILIENYAPVFRTIKLKEALQKKWISDFVVFNLGLKLNSYDMKEYERINKRFNYYFSFFNHNFELAMGILRDPMLKADYAAKIDADPKDVMVAAVNFARFLRQRKTFLYESSTKLLAVRQIAQAFDRKMIIFSETNQFADRIVDVIGDKAFAFHSGVGSKKLMRQNLEKFKKSEQFSVVSAVKAIEEGLDVDDLEMAVLVSGNSTKRQYIQRIGRSLRIKGEKVAVIINIYIYGTQDQNWLKKRQASNAVNVYWVEDVQTIKQYVDTFIDTQATATHADGCQYTDKNCSTIAAEAFSSKS